MSGYIFHGPRADAAVYFFATQTDGGNNDFAFPVLFRCRGFVRFIKLQPDSLCFAEESRAGSGGDFHRHFHGFCIARDVARNGSYKPSVNMSVNKINFARLNK